MSSFSSAVFSPSYSIPLRHTVPQRSAYLSYFNDLFSVLGMQAPHVLGSSVSLHECEEKERVLAFQELVKCASREAGVDGWDGPGSRAVKAGAVEDALRLYRYLPSSLDLPEVTATPTGELAFEWVAGPDCQMTVLLTGDRRASMVSLVNGLSALTAFGLDGIIIPDSALETIGAWQRGIGR